MLKLLDSNPKAFTIVYGAIGSLLASALWVLAPEVTDWVKRSSIELLIRFINERFEAAASLEPVNYSLYALTIALVVTAIAWFSGLGTVRKKIFTTNNSVPPPAAAEPSRAAKVFVYLVLQIGVPLALLYFLGQLFGQVLTLNAMTGFNQRMRITAPYMTQEEGARLLSDWSQMRTVDDYDRIFNRLSAVAKANGLRLPRTPTY